MPSYSYKAFDSEGSVQSGFINAESERLARKEIKSLNLIPHKLKEIKSQTTKRYKIKNKDLVLATRQIGTLLEAAAQIDEALKMTAEQVKNKDLKNILFNLRDEIIQGKRLGNAMDMEAQQRSSTRDCNERTIAYRANRRFFCRNRFCRSQAIPSLHLSHPRHGHRGFCL